MLEGQYYTLITTRYAGGSYLKRVELLNGCLSMRHSEIFIPSTIHGSNMDTDSGKINEKMLKQNLDTATDVYIDKVKSTTFGGKEIGLMKGDTSSIAEEHQEWRARLTTFLKGPKYKKESLKVSHEKDYQHFIDVWRMRSRHMVRNLPKNYVFMLLPCFEKSCPHPVCKRGEINHYQRYSGGPSVKFLPLPVKDPKRPKGNVQW